MGSPTTVRGWLGRMPRSLFNETERLLIANLGDLQCSEFGESILWMSERYDTDSSRRSYWMGVRKRLAIGGDILFSHRHSKPFMEGYEAAHNAQSEKPYQVTELWEGGDVVPVPRMDYETLTRKAALHDDLKAKLDVAIASLEELRRLFV
jgi:hypothetical protein